MAILPWHHFTPFYAIIKIQIPPSAPRARPIDFTKKLVISMVWLVFLLCGCYAIQTLFSGVVNTVLNTVNTASEACVHLFRRLADNVLTDVRIDVHGR